MTHRWTCQDCGQTATQEESVDVFPDPARMHAASHAKGLFDNVWMILVEVTS